MLKKRMIALFIIASSVMNHTLKADEGMWLPLLVKRLNHADMKKMGCKLSADEIYNVNKSSLKDAIVMLSGGSCTAEAISAEGLLLTNHHCGYDAIQSHSSVDHDYLTDGFWAANKTKELPSEGLTASFLQRIEDVTQKVLSEITADMSETQRAAKVREVSAIISKQATEGTNLNAAVKEFFDGNEYYLFVYKTYTDIRLVGAPPESVGKFGGDTDNWMWPRHTGDFTLLRVYAGADNEPAPYSESNVAYKPNHFLPISLDGVKQDDFSMVMGYPGRTDRYLTSFGVQAGIDITNPMVVKIREAKLNVMKEDMDASKDVRIKYASKYAQTANYWKYFIGQTEQLKKNNVVEKKKELERQFTEWVNKDPQRQAKYGNALKEIEAGYVEYRKHALQRTFLSEAFLQGADIILFGYIISNMKQILGAGIDETMVTQYLGEFVKQGDNFFKDFNLPTDKKLMFTGLTLYKEGLPKEGLPDIFDTINVKYGGNMKAYIDYLYANSFLASKNRFDEFMAKPTMESLEADPIIQLVNNVMDNYNTKHRPRLSEITQRTDAGNRLFVAGLREMKPDKKFYPNANSTMRLTYGQVKKYNPRDGVKYLETTTLKGVMEKEDPTNDEFIVPEKLKTLYNNKDYGIYGNAGDLNTCFISTNDITGGNSGSPVINGSGHLIGCAFDGNWEAMSGDIFFEPNVQRTISVDVRYILFIIDKYAGAGHIVDEMKLMKKGKVVKRS
jgi:hypothetical protein